MLLLLKYFVVSDIHGQFDKFITAITEVGFEQNNPNHKLIICGDLFDRGVQNLKLYQYIKTLLEEDLDNLIVLKGNHELFFNHIIEGKKDSITFNIQYNGFGKTLSSFTDLDYSSIIQNLDNLKEIINNKHPKLLDWISHLPFYYETKNHVFTHAGIDYQIDDWHDTNWPSQVWTDLTRYQHVNLKKYGFHKKIVMGHFYTSRLTGIDKNDIYFHSDDQKIFIDGGVAMGDRGQINVLVIEDEALL